jgi:hypothetical protein
VPQYTTAVTPAQALAAGATGLTELASSPAILEALRNSYSQAVRHVSILGLAFACFALLPSCAMEWLNITKESEKRKRVQEEKKSEHDREKDTGCVTEVVNVSAEVVPECLSTKEWDAEKSQ